MGNITNKDIKQCKCCLFVVIIITLTIIITGIVIFTSSCYDPGTKICWTNDYYESVIIDKFVVDKTCESAYGTNVKCYNGYLKINYDNNKICYINIFANNKNYDISCNEINQYYINSTIYINSDINDQICDFYHVNQTLFYIGLILIIICPGIPLTICLLSCLWASCVYSYHLMFDYSQISSLYQNNQNNQNNLSNLNN